ncbi:PhoX family protein [Azotobacter vinelandii]|uniref:PhoX family protein n=1 Tax=Azotobacter vinelandii TaxID=354 RepID=UPI0007745DD9|nr:PhoX family phosphatase [Azotobacter vinelandii]WKN19999.1 PhoX family phosphatase [Azotobacter vinelandii]
MRTDKDTALSGDGDEIPSNHSNNPHIDDLIQGIGRRQVIAGGMAMGMLAFLGVTVPRTGNAGEARGLLKRPSRLAFEAVAVTRADTISVPEGYQAKTFIPWGTPICGSYPAYREDGSNTAQEQAEQTGMHHDGMHYFPIDTRNGKGHNSEHGLLVLNHEYIDAPLLHPNGPTLVDGKRTIPEEVRKEINAHGVSVVEIRRSPRNGWEVVGDSKFGRRITAATPMEIRGPARGHALLRTRYSRDGSATRGTQNNCSNGFTPWGTYLTCEENWANYFATQDSELPRELQRYGIGKTGRFGWNTLEGDEFQRFDATRKAETASGDYRNEPNHFGWIVEIDPFDPQSVPVKHTALGRFAHEGVIFAPTGPGKRLVCYSGDDSRNEYIYKYVSRDKFRPGRPDNSRLLDEGTLYVARFNADGTGDWLPLDIQDATFQAACAAKGIGFADQGEVLINTRTAADAVGATKMDRPEWGAVHPRSGEVYFTLTNNTNRTEADAANPRPDNAYGHIIRWREESPEHTGTRFNWDLFLLAGPEGDSRGPDNQPLGADNILASPDGLWFDPQGLLWIQTDMSGSQHSDGPFGNNQMLVANPDSGELKRFLVGPVGCEVTGITATPDFRTLFVNIQHPGEGSTPDNLLSTWPDGPGKRPRSSTVVITREGWRRVL